MKYYIIDTATGMMWNIQREAWVSAAGHNNRDCAFNHVSEAKPVMDRLTVIGINTRLVRL